MLTHVLPTDVHRSPNTVSINVNSSKNEINSLGRRCAAAERQDQRGITAQAGAERYRPHARAAALATPTPAGSRVYSANANKMARSLDGVELIVAQDHFLTPTARHADIVLPATTFWERNDVHTPWAGAGHYAIYMKQAIQPMYECRNDMAIFADLAARLGINDYDDRTEEQWLRELTRGAVDDCESFRENGVARFAPPKDAVAFAQQIRDPDNHKFTTPSGKIEIYSMAMAAKPDPYGLGAMPPIPTWFEPVEPDAKYPLMLCSPKSRARTHSIHGNQPLLARVDPDDVWMNPADARARGISDGQTVRIFNDRGSTVLPVKVTSRIASGVISIKEGAWFTPDADGTDTQGCANVLAEDRSAPCGATTYNTNLVEVERA
jgi:anaerobic selenocysteine-containing dehydrogenase